MLVVQLADHLGKLVNVHMVACRRAVDMLIDNKRTLGNQYLAINNKIKLINKEIDEFVPWKKNKDQRKEFLVQKLAAINSLGQELKPIIPDTAEKIINSTQGKIAKIAPLFPKI